MNVDRVKLTQTLKTFEGLKLTPYVDTKGNVTIGYGHNLTGYTITQDEAETLLNDDIDAVIAALDAQPTSVICFDCINSVRQQVLVEMAYQLGVGGLLQFRRMLGAVQRKDFNLAADEILASAAAQECPDRFASLAARMRAGV